MSTLRCALALVLTASIPAVEPALLAISIPDPARIQAPMPTLQDPAWAALAGRAQAVRGRLTGHGWSGGLPAMTWSAAWRSPTGGDPRGVGLRLARDGGWFHASLGPPAGTAEEVQTPADGREAVRGECHLPALAAALPPARAGALARLVMAWGATTAVGSGTRDADGPVETIRLAGARFPLVPVDPASLAGLPADAPLVLAWGQSRGAMTPFLTDVAILVGHDPALAQAPELIGIAAADLWSAVEGTVVVARLADGGWVLSLPAAAALDEAMAHVQAARPGATDLALAQEQPVALELPWFGPAQVRRTASRWLIARDPGIINILAAEPPPWTSPWPGEGRPILVLRAAAGFAGIAAWLPEPLAGMVPAHGPGPLVLALAEDSDGVRIDARHGPLWWAAGVLLSVGPRLPELAVAEAATRRRLAEEQLRGMLAAGAFRAGQMEGMWPRDLADLLRGPVPGAPGRPDIAIPWAYVRPVDGADGRPVLVQDPACTGGAGSLVGFRDGRIAFVEGRIAWDAAQRVLSGQGSEDL